MPIPGGNNPECYRLYEVRHAVNLSPHEQRAMNSLPKTGCVVLQAKTKCDVCLRRWKLAQFLCFETVPSTYYQNSSYCLLLGLSATGLACPGLLWTISLCAHRAHQRYAWRSMTSSREIHSCVMMFAGMLPVLLASHNGCLAACRAGETRSRLKTGCPKPLSRLQLRVGDWTDLAALKRNITSQPQLVSAMTD